MKGETPKFCRESEEHLFSDACEAFTKIRPTRKASLLQLISNSKFYDEHKQIICGKKLKKHHSVHFKKRNYKFHKNINIFMKKNKFILRNDFDKKNVEKFLLSKEQAFMDPILLVNEIL